jgi:hypothetical protein
MTRVLVWKELRQQWVVWLAMAVVSAGGVWSLAATTNSSRQRDEMLVVVLWFAAGVYGLIGGSLLLAGETEEETQGFLDVLPVTRRRLWSVKAGAGLLPITALVAVLGVIWFVLLPQTDASLRSWSVAAGLLLCGVSGYAWGLYCGSYARTVLGAVTRGAVLQAVVGAILFAAVVVRLGVNGRLDGIDSRLQWTDFSVALVFAAAGAAALSRATYCHPDRLRARPDLLTPARSWWNSLRLAVSQARWFAIGMAVGGVVGMLIEVRFGVFVWPAVTLLIGVIAGATVYPRKCSSEDAVADDARDLYARAIVHFAVAVGATALTALVATGAVVELLSTGGREHIRALVRRVTASVANELLTQPVLFLTLWLVYGFSGGLLCSLLTRRPVRAGVQALGIALPAGALWVPAVFSGGPIYGWQVWGPPTVLFAAIVLLIQARSVRASLSRGDIATAVAAVVVAGSWQAGALWYRATEMPPAPDVIDLTAFRASLPAPGANVGGELAASALRRLSELAITTIDETPEGLRLHPFGRPLTAPTHSFFDFFRHAEAVADNTWHSDDDGLRALEHNLRAFLDRNLDLRAFLDLEFDDVWAKQLAESANLPTGVLVDPRETTEAALFVIPESRTPEIAATMLVARGLQRQADGDPGTFVDNLRTGLSLARNLRNHSGRFLVSRSLHVERRMLGGVEKWLERLEGRPDLLRKALEILRHHGEQPLTDAEEQDKADYLVALNTVDDVTALPARGAIGRPGQDPFFPMFGFPDTEVLRVCLEAPGEKERRHRILSGLYFPDAGLRQLAKQLQSPLLNGLFRNGVLISETTLSPWYRSLVPMTTLQVALRLYREETGRPAERLDELVPKYLPAVPADPYDGHPIRYRLSKGEEIDWSDRQEGSAGPAGGAMPSNGPYQRTVSAGQGVLWCVGEDGRDDGGHAQRGAQAGQKEDLIVLVPLPPSRH